MNFFKRLRMLIAKWIYPEIFEDRDFYRDGFRHPKMPEFLGYKTLARLKSDTEF